MGPASKRWRLITKQKIFRKQFQINVLRSIDAIRQSSVKLSGGNLSSSERGFSLKSLISISISDLCQHILLSPCQNSQNNPVSAPPCCPMNWILACDWSMLITWPEYWPLIGGSVPWSVTESQGWSLYNWLILDTQCNAWLQPLTSRASKLPIWINC